MTRIPKEEAIKYFEDMKNGYWLFDMAIEALKKEPNEAILDYAQKMKMIYHSSSPYQEGYREAMSDIIQFIKGESEDEV